MIRHVVPRTASAGILPDAFFHLHYLLFLYLLLSHLLRIKVIMFSLSNQKNKVIKIWIKFIFIKVNQFIYHLIFLLFHLVSINFRMVFIKNSSILLYIHSILLFNKILVFSSVFSILFIILFIRRSLEIITNLPTGFTLIYYSWNSIYSCWFLYFTS